MTSLDKLEVDRIRADHRTQIEEFLYPTVVEGVIRVKFRYSKASDALHLILDIASFFETVAGSTRPILANLVLTSDQLLVVDEGKLIGKRKIVSSHSCKALPALNHDGKRSWFKLGKYTFELFDHDVDSYNRFANNN